VARHADVDRIVERRLGEHVEHRLVVGVDRRLVGVGGELPSAQLGLDGLHRQVRTLDEPDPRPATSASKSLRRPLAEVAGHAADVGQVCLQHDPGVEAGELGMVECASERRDGQFEVAVFLHVEVDEHRRLACSRLAIEPVEHLDQPIDGVIERQGADACADRRDLDGHVVDVRSAESLDHHGESLRGLAVTDDRLAEDVDVRSDTLVATEGEVAAETGIVGGQHDVARLVAQPSLDERHHQVWQSRGERSADPERESVGRGEGAQVGVGDEACEAATGQRAVGDARDLVGKVDREQGGARIVDDRAQAAPSSSVPARCSGVEGGRVVHPSPGERDGVVDAPFVAAFSVPFSVGVVLHVAAVSFPDRCTHQAMQPHQPVGG
jgi:hypothetical protein